MRLRVKSAAQPGIVWRVEAQEGFTLDQLNHAVATACFAPERVEELEKEICISLNKRVRICNCEPDARLVDCSLIYRGSSFLIMNDTPNLVFRRTR